MLVTDIIRKKRDGGELTPDEIAFFVRGLADDSIPAEQVAALAMAVFFNSMTCVSVARVPCLTGRTRCMQVHFRDLRIRREYQR